MAIGSSRCSALSRVILKSVLCCCFLLCDSCPCFWIKALGVQALSIRISSASSDAHPDAPPNGSGWWARPGRDRRRRALWTDTTTREIGVNRWYLDGNNIIGHRGTPRDRHSVEAQLYPFQGQESVYLVWDGPRNLRPDHQKLTTQPMDSAKVDSSQVITASTNMEGAADQDQTPMAANNLSADPMSMVITTSIYNHRLHVVQLPPHCSADDWIVQHIDDYCQSWHSSPSLAAATTSGPPGDTAPLLRVHIVTADRALRAQVLQRKSVVRTVVHPVTFWRRYLPRLCGYKKANNQATGVEGELAS